MDDWARRHGTFADHDRLSRGGAASSCASPNAAGASCGCSVPSTWRTLETRELPPRKPAVWARFSYLISTNPVSKGKVRVPLYPVSPEAPAGARALPPQAVAGWLVATLDARLGSRGGFIATHGPGHRIVLGSAGALRTARHTVNSSSCWPRSSIAASAGACHLPTKPWSEPISRACPTTDRPKSTTERRRQSSSGFGRLGPSEPRCGSGPPSAARRSRSRLR